MAALENPRHERFALGLFEGKSAGKAYQNAGYKPNRGNAIRLKANESIKARLAELQAEAAKQAGVTKEEVYSLLRNSYEAALAANQHGPAVRAAELLGKDVGMFKDRVSVEVSNMSDDELVKAMSAENPELAGILNTVLRRSRGETIN
ncbi:MAG: hypothetical protein IH905_04775 [Proteobacteria bacterium]|nr:hypothetical protein [Pseudomonadota bacterium]